NGVAKTYAMTGWRVGWMISPPDVTKAAANLQSHLTSNVANVSQRAALAAVSGPLDAVAEVRVPRGAFYVYPSVKPLLGKEIRGVRPETSVELAALVLEHAEVAVVPGE